VCWKILFELNIYIGCCFVLLWVQSIAQKKCLRWFCMFKKHTNFFNKAQGTIEYLIIISIIVVIALVVVGILTGFLDTGNGVSVSENKLFWSSQALGIADAGVDEDGDAFFVVTNNTGSSITLTGYRVNGVSKSFTGTQPVIASGGKKVVFVDGQDACGGSACSWDDFSLAYTTNLGLTKLSSDNALVLEKQSNISRLSFSGSALVCVNNDDLVACSGSSGESGVGTDSNLFSLGFFDVDSNALLIDLNGGGRDLFGFVDGNFSGNVKVDGNLILNGVMKRDSCPSGYVLVPGNSDFGTSDFCVMKYEAQLCDATCVSAGNGARAQAVSVQGGSPWTDVSWYDAREACRRSGGHLINNAEWMTIARNIEAQASNWQSGVVGSGCMYGGHMDNLPASKLATSDDGSPYYGTASSDETTVTCPFAAGADNKKASKRTMVLSNGSIVWDLSGNVWEWVDEQCANASGYSSTYWYNSGAWVDWSHASLSDYELYVAGPTSGYTSSNGAGKYYGCTTNGNSLFRGAHWYDGVIAGVFTVSFYYSPFKSFNYIGFRCVR
jgi:formylglycine-generating enzyme required for sulfatase activity